MFTIWYNVYREVMIMGRKGFGSSYIERLSDSERKLKMLKEMFEKKATHPCINCEHNDQGYCYKHHLWCEKAKLKCINK